MQTFKCLMMIHKVLQEGHPVTVKEAQQNVNWIESLARGIMGEGLRGELLLELRVPTLVFAPSLTLKSTSLSNLRLPGYGPLIREYVFYLLSKLGFHRHHPEFNGEPIKNDRKCDN